MANELQELQAEVARLRRDLNRVLDLLDQRNDDPEYPPPAYGRIEMEQLSVRCSKDAIPAIVHADPEEAGVYLYDQKHCNRVSLFTRADGAVGLSLRNAEGKEIVSIGEGADGGGQVAVFGADGTPRVCLRSEQQDGLMTVVGPRGQPLVFMRGAEHGGQVTVVSQQQRQAVVLTSSEQGGIVTLHEPSGQIMNYLTATPNGGVVTVYGEQGMPGATLSACGELAGMAVFYNVDGEVKTMLP